MGYHHCSWVLLPCLIWSFLILGSHQLQSSQTQVLLQLRKQLEYPIQLEIWKDHTVDFCSLVSSTQVNVTCQDNFVSELRIIGDKPAKANNFAGFAIPDQTLSGNFSIDSFVVTLSRLTSLRILSLVSLGIWGPLPDKIHRLASLEYLDLSSNYLFGSVPPKISSMVKLQTLVLDQNFLNDTVPNWFDALSNLKVLSLKNNQLMGPFPTSLQKLTSLTDLVLSSNKITGKLPSLDALVNLNVLDLSYNELTGALAAAMFSLSNIRYLNLASNRLTGSLPNHLSCGNNLQFVDISDNRLTGGLPHCLSVESDKRIVKFGGNCLSIDLHHQHAESSCMEIIMPMKKTQSGGKGVGIALLVGVVAAILIIVGLLAFGFLVVCRRYCPRAISEQHLLHKPVPENSTAGFSSEILNNARFISQAAKLGTQGLPVCRPFTLEELKEATNNFDNSTVLGEGSYGNLYKGRLNDGTQVAIRCLPSSRKYSIRNLKLRLDLLAKLRHPHLVCLLGHCIDGGDHYRVNKVFLIHEYTSNGNFRTLLLEDSPGKVLNWSERLSTVSGVAKAVHFLHTGVIPGFFNNRLKTNNILLNEHGISKLSDYGLSIVSEDIGSCGEDEAGVKSQQMARLEDDVYSFGFILLDALFSPALYGRRDKLLQDELASTINLESHRKLINPVVLATSSQESLSIVISITNKCICSESWSRPSFEDILWNLQYATQVQETADGVKT